jgi:uncharacterized membrane protein
MIRIIQTAEIALCVVGLVVVVLYEYSIGKTKPEVACVTLFFIVSIVVVTVLVLALKLEKVARGASENGYLSSATKCSLNFESFIKYLIIYLIFGY